MKIRTKLEVIKTRTNSIRNREEWSDGEVNWYDFNRDWLPEEESKSLELEYQKLSKSTPLLNNPTLLKSFDDQPEWCKSCITSDSYMGFKLGQLVLDLNNTLARIVHIAPALNLFRLSLIDEEGNQFAEVTSEPSYIKVYNWKQTNV